MHRTLIFAGVFLLAAAAAATAPDILTYQGRLLSGGAPVNGQRDVAVDVCDAPTGGSCFNTGSQTVDVANGLFKMQFNAPPSINLADGPRWLQLRVGPAGGPVSVLSPRERLTSAPYAVYASTAATLRAAPNAAGVRISTHVGIGVLPAADLHVSRAAQTKLLVEATGAGSNHALFELSSKSGTAGSSIVLLERAGTGGTAGIMFRQGGVDFWQLLFESAAFGNQFRLMGGPTPRLVVDPAGQLGVGNESPSARLHVSSAGAAAADVLFRVDDGAGIAALALRGDGQLRLFGGTGGAAKLQVGGDTEIQGHLSLVGGASSVTIAGLVGISSSALSAPSVTATLGQTTVGGLTVSGGKLRAVGGGAPSLGAGCGTGASISGNDTAGKITIGTAALSNPCVVTFATAFSSAPVCLLQNESSFQARLRVVTTASQMEIYGDGGAPPFVSGQGFFYLCIGQ